MFHKRKVRKKIKEDQLLQKIGNKILFLYFVVSRYYSVRSLTNGWNL